jgi:hypothetical protein
MHLHKHRSYHPAKSIASQNLQIFFELIYRVHVVPARHSRELRRPGTSWSIAKSKSKSTNLFHCVGQNQSLARIAELWFQRPTESLRAGVVSAHESANV